MENNQFFLEGKTRRKYKEEVGRGSKNVSSLTSTTDTRLRVTSRLRSLRNLLSALDQNPVSLGFLWSTPFSISQTDLGHLMRFTQCRISYRFSTDVHGKRTPFISQRTE